MSPEFHIVAGVVIFLMAVSGVISNGGVMMLSKRAGVFNSGVGRLIRCEATGALLYCLVFLFYVSPALTFDLTSWKKKPLSARFGHVAIFSHDVCLFSHTCISFNRFIAAYFPSHYNSLFTPKKIEVLLWFIPILAALATAVHFFEPCWLYFFWDGGFFVYETFGCGEILALYIQFPRNMVLVIVCSSVDLASLAKLRFINQKFRETALADAEWRRRHRIELALTAQVCFQAMMYIIEFLTYFIISSHFTDPYLVFFLTTFAWQAIHTTDGLVVFLFNSEMRKTLWKRGQTSTVQVVSSGARGSLR